MAEENEINNDQEMAEEKKNGDAIETNSKSKELLDYGLNESVVKKVEELVTAGKLTFSELDERALETLKEFPVDSALAVLKEFMDSSLEHVSNKSAYLCGIMKIYHRKTKLGAQGVTAKGPDDEKIKAILERTGYTLDVMTRQRKYGGPPPNWDQAPPGCECKVFVGKIPKPLFEDELIPVFEKCGQIWDLTLMMDAITGQNRGYAFVTYCTKESAESAVEQLNNYEIKSGKNLTVSFTFPNLRLFVGNIPKSKSKDEILEEFSKLTVGLKEVVIFSVAHDKMQEKEVRKGKKNRGFCFLEYESHEAASSAMQKLESGKIKVWESDIAVDWADFQDERDEDSMSEVKVLYARNLTDKKLEEMFTKYGKVEKVKKIKDYAFIHFAEKESAIKVKEAMNGKQIGSAVEVSLAKPLPEKKKKEEKKKKVLKNRGRGRRMMQTPRRGRGRVPGILPTPPRGGQGIRVWQTPPMLLPPSVPRNYDYNFNYCGGYGEYPAFGGGGGGGGGGGLGGRIYGEPPYFDDFRAPPYEPYEDYRFDCGYSNPPRPYQPSCGPLLPLPPQSLLPVPRNSGGRIARSVAPRASSVHRRGVPSRERGGARGSNRGASRGKPGAGRGNKQRGNKAGKRKFDNGHQNQRASKRNFQNNRGSMGNNSWGNQRLSQQPRNASGGNMQWYNDSFDQQWA